MRKRDLLHIERFVRQAEALKNFLQQWPGAN